MDRTYVINSSKAQPSGVLVFLHGSGDSGPGLGHTVRSLIGTSAQLPHIKIIFPTAPVLPFSAYGGMAVNTWYDISDFSEDAIENVQHIEKSADILNQIVKKEVSSGIPLNRIVCAGFSRGGAMSYYMGYSYLKGVAGVGVLSSWLPKSSFLHQKIKESKEELPPLFQTHGGSDFVIKRGLAEKSVELFKSYGINTDFKIYPSLGHEVSPDVLSDLYSFVQRVIPNN